VLVLAAWLAPAGSALALSLHGLAATGHGTAHSHADSHHPGEAQQAGGRHHQAGQHYADADPTGRPAPGKRHRGAASDLLLALAHGHHHPTEEMPEHQHAATCKTAPGSQRLSAGVAPAVASGPGATLPAVAPDGEAVTAALTPAPPPPFHALCSLRL
jgi:hypothetical protein